MADRENAGNDPTLNNSSPDGQETSSEMLKPWMKTLGKDFYKNEELAKYESLKDAVNGLLARPKAKELPESYGYGDADELYRKAGITKEEADAIESYWGKKVPARQDRKAVFGDAYDEMERNYSKAVGVFGDDLQDEIKSNGLDRDPVFAKVMAKVGKELGPANFITSTKDGKPAKVNVWEAIRNKSK